MAAPKTIIISSANDKYLVVANDLFASIAAQKFKHNFDLGLLDIGLSEPSRQHLQGLGVRVEKARVDIDYPSRTAWEEKKPGFRTFTARLFARDYFPGYDIYIWLDADLWVQTPDAIDTMIDAVIENQCLHIAVELDRCYRTFFDSADMWMLYRNWYQANYGAAIAEAMTLKPILNIGMWAMGRESPVWEAWQKICADALPRMARAADTNTSFMIDQLGLNILLYLEKLPHVILPANFNWLTFYALPMWDKATGLYVEPVPPHRVISQIHLTRPAKFQDETIACTDGSTIRRSLMYSAKFF